MSNGRMPISAGEVIRSMNKIARVRAALQGQPVDRMPASFWFHFRPDQAAGQAMAEAHLTYYRAADPDYLKVMNDNGYELLGIEAIQRASDWRHIRPAPLSSRPFQAQLDGLKAIVDEIGNEAPIITTIFNPLYTANKSATGGVHPADDKFPLISAHLHEDPEAVAAGLAAIAVSLADFSQACIAVGAAGIYFSANGGERHRFPDDLFAQYIQPHDIAVLHAAAEAGAYFNLLHICGSALRMESYTDYPAHAINWAPQLENISLAAGRDLFQRTVVGGMDHRPEGVLVMGDQAAITTDVCGLLTTMGTSGYILGAGCTVPPTTPIEHFVWARQAVSTT